MTTKYNQVLVIGLDAAEPALIERWMADGTLPNLEKLKENGVYTRIGKSNDHLVGLPWPTFYRGINPGGHGVYHYLQWDPAEMASKRVSQNEYNLQPFWRKFRDGGPRAIVIDVPLTTSPTDFNGIEFVGWATHETLNPLSAFPDDVLNWANKEICLSPAFEERYGMFTASELLQNRDNLITMTEKVSKLSQALITKEDWDLFIVVFSATHRAGHQLWDGTNIISKMSEFEADEISRALKQVYKACDQAIGNLIQEIGEDVSVYVFSLHGMGINQSRTELLPEMVTRILVGNAEQAISPRPKLSSQLRGLIPETWRHAIKRRMPLRVQDKLTSYWRMGATEWSKTPVITLLGDYDGYLRVNLKGRESQGIVDPKDFETWIQIITEGLMSFIDADSGEPIVRQVLRREDLGLSGVGLHHFPDMIVQWQETPAARHRELFSQKYGTVPWPTPGRNPEGRSGNHRPQGFLIARGEHFGTNSSFQEIRVVDLAPTILNKLGLPVPASMEGKVIDSW